MTNPDWKVRWKVRLSSRCLWATTLDQGRSTCTATRWGCWNVDYVQKVVHDFADFRSGCNFQTWSTHGHFVHHRDDVELGPLEVLIPGDAFVTEEADLVIPPVAASAQLDSCCGCSPAALRRMSSPPCLAARKRRIWRAFRCTEPMVSDNQAPSSAVGATSCKTVRLFDHVVFRKLWTALTLSVRLQTVTKTATSSGSQR